MTLSAGQSTGEIPEATSVLRALSEVARFGALMLRAGDTAFRARDWMGTLARRLGLDQLSAQLSLGSVIATARRGEEWATTVGEVGAPAVNASRIGALEALARDARLGETPGDLASRLSAIEGTPPLYSLAQTAAGIGLGCGAFAFLNGGGALEVATATLAGGAGQGLRTALLRRKLNQYAVASLCAVAAAGAYCLMSAVALRAGVGHAHHAAGIVSSALFLVPGFPLVAALLDLMQHQAQAALTRLAYGVMLLLASAFGLCIVSAIVGLDVTRPPPLELTAPLMLVLRALASFVGACAFAILYNSARRTVLSVGLLAVVGNELRLGLQDAGLIQASATFLGAFSVGLLASLVRHRLSEPRIALTVPGIIMMVPGYASFQAIVLFTRGDMIPALQALVQVAFVVGAMAMGLATARFVTLREWRSE